ncbi:MAG: histidine kinase [Sphingobacteriales bacterium SCN 48-20]|uniref:response regulator n=1 Tax=Terrimonas ferruginea TaxID=249 RepID=UPI00086BBA85|nr:response regulator [Terrimonas ferruginea]MBN8783809.1 response regulator [Terrimonas ferruginea]ODT93093.1 MAG: histidine kinase [Sphingobacteriales bacterium SCN 48-20]OJW40854.1 MAG: response regulator [Sphingobacteriales bacterium 48-107]
MSNHKILIIDDDAKNIFALTATLRSRGYESTSATSAEEGIRMAAADPLTGIILLDMMMPGTDGYQALRMIRGHEQLQKLPVIAVTAQAMKGDKEKCLEAGADDYISKPIDVDRLMERLAHFLA